MMALLAVSSCDSQDRAGIDGHLYFASDNYLGDFDMDTGVAVVAANLGNLSIQQVGPFRDDELLVAVVASIDGRDIHKIVHINPADNYVGTLYLGRRAHYLADVDAIVYDDGHRLYVRSVEGEFPRRVVGAGVSPSSRPDVVPVSGHAFIYRDVVDGRGEFRLYDARSDSSRGLPGLSDACDLDGALWIDPAGQLLCHAAGGAAAGYRFAGLDGEVREAEGLPHGGRLRALAYLPDRRLVVLAEVSTSWFTGRPRHGVWVYDPELQEARRVSKDQFLGDSVAYRRTSR